MLLIIFACSGKVFCLVRAANLILFTSSHLDTSDISENMLMQIQIGSNQFKNVFGRFRNKNHQYQNGDNLFRNRNTHFQIENLNKTHKLL